MPRRPDLKCNRCGETKWRGTTSLPEGEYRCQPCRRIEPYRPKSQRLATCPECGCEFVSVRRSGGWTECCSKPCAGRRRMRINPPPRVANSVRAIPTEWTERTRRKFREAVTPGLSIRQRRALLAEWVASGATCAYCTAPATTVDHIIPLSRGGTNYEGNLVPCCRPCNSSKCDLLLIEWRLGRAHGLTYTDRPWMQIRSRARRARPAKVRSEFTLILDISCPVCVQTFTPANSRRVTCSATCSREWAARQTRNAYRRKVGKPEDWTTPTKKRGGRDATSDGHQVRQVRRQPDRAA